MPKVTETERVSGGGASIVEPSSEQQTLIAQSEVRSVVRISAIAFAGFLVLYLVFFALYLGFPYLRPGDNLVSDYKHSQAREGNLFQSTGKIHVMAFGYSKTLAGFIPKLFDSELAAAGIPPVESYNFGLPGDTRFVADLEAMAKHNTAPKIALLTFPWPDAPDPKPTFFHFIDNDWEMMDLIFPFRHLPRDFVIMATDAHGLSDMPKYYAQSRQAVEQVAADRGYFFIARQSHFPNDELPPGYRLSTDTPTETLPREVPLGPVYQELAAVLAKHKIECIFVPLYFREGEFAPPPAINQDTVRTLAQQPFVDIIGPDYWIYPNNFFSDPKHANRPGARAYTIALASLVAEWMKQHPNKIR